MQKRVTYRKGFSFIELLIGMAIGSIILGVITLFYTRGVALSREQFEQILTTQEARVSLERIGETIRNARDVDTNGNGIIEAGEGWLLASDDNSVQIYSDVTGDDIPEKIRFSLAGTTIERGVITRNGDGEYIDSDETVSQIASHIRNIDAAQPVFTLIPGDQTSIKITIHVDVNVNQSPGAAIIYTLVFPRAETNTATVLSPRLWPVSINLPQDPPISENAELTTTDPDTLASTSEVVQIVAMNTTRLSTYGGNYHVNINYQNTTVGSDLPGWYAWVGPILVGQSGSQQYYVNDKMPVSDLCLGGEIADLLTDCAVRTVSSGAFSRSYQPILRHIGPASGEHDYIKEILFTYAGE